MYNSKGKGSERKQRNKETNKQTNKEETNNSRRNYFEKVGTLFWAKLHVCAFIGQIQLHLSRNLGLECTNN